jgi:ubiquinone/menaquinone biosynthesis C-methylase UbiE
MSVKQKNIFLNSEGDAWYERNKKDFLKHYGAEEDPIVAEIRSCIRSDTEIHDLLEIGCGDGYRLEWLNKNLGLKCFGIDPSSKAISKALKRGVNAQQATADSLPFSDDSFDIVVFGFCLYLCDREDLFKIACESDRVLKSGGWLIIHDFYSEKENITTYKHYLGMYSFKMDYSKLFEWHPFYNVYSKKINAHLSMKYTNDEKEWVSTFVLRKYKNK